jgi:hypothetical protein
VLSWDARLSRRRFLTLAAATAGAAAVGTDAIAQGTTDVVIPAPYFPQGWSGANARVNCGPATVAAAINYSGVASPTVADVRATLGRSGPTNIDQWAWLLNWYGVRWYSTWSRWEMNAALRTGHVLVIAAWMSHFSSGWDFEQPWSPNWGQAGRYNSFRQGHALLVVGTSDGGANYVVHDPNVFEGGTYWYSDGTPKGAFRKYNAAELWYTVANYADGLALAVAPPPVLTTPRPVKRIRPERGQKFSGPGGGHTPQRGVVDPAELRAEHGAEPSDPSDPDSLLAHQSRHGRPDDQR